MLHAGGSGKKRQRVGSSGRLSSSPSASSFPDLLNDGSLASASAAGGSQLMDPPSVPGGFNDASTADVLLRLHLDPDALPSLFSPAAPPLDPLAVAAPSSLELELHLHSSALVRSQYFNALLSDRWRQQEEGPERGAAGDGAISRFNLKVPPSARNPNRPFEAHIAVLRLLYTLDFQSAILNVADALYILHVSLELLFDDCIRACVRFLEAVPWSEEEERMILQIVPFLREEESGDLLARVMPPAPRPESARAADGFASSAEEMLYGLIHTAIHSHPSVVSVKLFVAKLLKDFTPKVFVQRVLDRAFLASLELVKEKLAEYASPDFRVAVDNDGTEAIQRLNLHAALVNTRKLLWLVERMIELRVADTAVVEWSNQVALAGDLQKAFRDEASRNIAPALPALVMRCTGRLANAVATGTILATRQVRMNLVEGWLPVLNICRDIVSPLPSGQRLIYQELEETFLKIISTLPMSDSCKLLQQCLTFSTRNVDDCPYLVSAFNTWFRRANQPPVDENT